MTLAGALRSCELYNLKKEDVREIDDNEIQLKVYSSKTMARNMKIHAQRIGINAIRDYMKQIAILLGLPFSWFLYQSFGKAYGSHSDGK